MSINIDMRQFENINFSQVTQQLQVFNVQLQNAATNKQALQAAATRLNSQGMTALSGSLGSVQGLFQSLGVELGSMPKRLLSVTTATTGLLGSMQRLSELRVVSQMTDTLGRAWEDSGKQVDTFRIGLRNLGTDLKANGVLTTAQTKLTGLLTAAQVKLGTAMTAVKTKLTLKAIAKGALTAMMLPLKVAKIAFNALLKANPIGLLIAGIGTLVALGPRLIGFFTGANRAARTHERAVSELSDQYGVSTEQIESDMERMDKTCEETWSNINQAAQDAANTFGGCADEIRGEIADLIAYHGDYDLAIEAFREQQIEMLADVGKQWGLTGQEVYDALGDMTLDEFVAGQEAQLGELSEAWNMSTQDIQEALQEQGISMEEFADQQKELLQNNAEEWGLYAEDVQAHMSEMGMSADEWAAHMGEAWKQFNADVQSNVSDVINGFREIPTEYSQSAEELRQIMEANTETTRQWQENMGELAGQVSPEMLAHLEAMGPEFNSVIEEMLACDDELQAWIDAMDDATAVGTQQALANVEDPVIHDAIVHQLDATGQAVANHTALADGYEEMLNDANDRAVTVAQQGGGEVGEAYGNAIVESATSADYAAIPDAVTGAMEAGQSGMVQSMTSATTAMVSAFRTGMMPLKLTATTTFASLVPLLQQSGRNMVSGLQNGIVSSTTLATHAMTTLATSMHTAFRTANQISSPSQLYRRSGGFIIDGLVAGLTAGQNRPTTRLQTIATNMRNVYNNVNSTYQAVGREIINGVNSGLLGREAHLIATAQRIANNIARTMRNALDINSPSRVMREQIGRFIPEGIAAGIDKYADAAIDSVHKLSNDIINLNLPSVESMIGLQPSMRLSGATGVGSTNNDYSVVNNNQGLFEGANINWSGEQDIRRTMEKIAWVTKQEQARLWR